jgi:hypothetical protein
LPILIPSTSKIVASRKVDEVEKIPPSDMTGVDVQRT